MCSSSHKHHHAHKGLGTYAELIFAILSGVFLAIGYGLSFTELAYLSNYLYWGAYFLGGYFTAKEAVVAIFKGGFEIDFLMLVAAIGAAILGEWAEGALLLFLFSLGHALEHYAMEKARRSIAALGQLSPTTALVKKAGELVEVAVGELLFGDTIVVQPHAKIAADGLVLKGASSVNQAAITGESMPVDKVATIDAQQRFEDLLPEHRVFSGTINGDSALEVKVLKLTADSTLSRLIELVSKVESQQSPTQHFTKKIERYFVPGVLLLVVFLCFGFLIFEETFQESFYRAMSVLVAASPCALAISTPSAVLSGVARAAQGGVLIKGGKALEKLGEITAITFDKTGTLTEGKPQVVQIETFGAAAYTDLLKTLLAIESLSTHPLAKAVSLYCRENLTEHETSEASEVEAIQGKGIKALYEGEVCLIGNSKLFLAEEGEIAESVWLCYKELQEAGNTVMLVKKGNTFMGCVALRDVPRAKAKETLSRLAQQGIQEISMLTGDNQNVANAIAKEVGISKAIGGLLPEEKVAVIRQMGEEGVRVAMVGDGVNDAPAMVSSYVSVAMGAAGSDVALEVADVALMSDRLERLPFVVGLSRSSKKIIRQNLFISLGVVAFLIPAAIIGVAGIGETVLLHEGSTLLVVFNALRLLTYREHME